MAHYKQQAKGKPLKALQVRGVYGKCSVDVCQEPAAHLGLCNTHYNRQRNGKPMDTPVLKHGVTLEERMKFYTGVSDDNGCWPWIGGVNASKYPVVAQGGTGNPCLMAHRVAYELAGNVLDHRPIHHKCGNKLCVNPDHLIAVEAHENTAEMFERKFYVKHIKALEDALRVYNPAHPLLDKTPVQLR